MPEADRLLLEEAARAAGEIAKHYFEADPTVWDKGDGQGPVTQADLEIDADGSVNVSRLSATPHRTAGAGGFVDITTRAMKIVFSGTFNAGAKMHIDDGKLVIDKEGHTAKFVEKVDQVSFSGKRATAQGQRATYVTERCVVELRDHGLTLTEIAPGLDLQRDVLDQAGTALKVADDMRTMDAALFQPGLIGLDP